MLFYPLPKQNDFDFSHTEIPHTYLVNKPSTFQKRLNFKKFNQLLDEAAAQDDLDAIWKIWSTSVKSSSRQLTNSKFPGILLATCRIVDMIGEIGSEWYSLGVVSTKSYKWTVLFVEGFAVDYYSYYQKLDAAEKVNFEEVYKAFDRNCYERVRSASGLKPYRKIFVDNRRTVYRSLFTTNK